MKPLCIHFASDPGAGVYGSDHDKIIGGIFSGAFASGGPLIVIYCTHRLSDKNIFRGTMFFSGCFSMGLVALEHFFQHHYTFSLWLYSITHKSG